MKKPYKGVLVLVLSVFLGACATQPVPEGEDLHRASELNAELGVAYMERGNNEWAMQKLKKALQEDPDNGTAHHYIAELYRRLGETDKAEDHFNRALYLLPHDMSLVNNYGVFLCDEKRFNDAQKYFLKVLDDPLNTSPAETYENLGICAQRAGDLVDAEKYLRQALRLDKARPKSLFSMAQIMTVNKHYLKARGFLERYLAIAKEQNAPSLWLGIQIERQLGNRDAVASYSLLLKGKYPDAPETQQLRKLEARQGQP